MLSTLKIQLGQNILLFTFCLCSNGHVAAADAPFLMYPVENDFREVKQLSGLWDFVLDSPNSNRGIVNTWWTKDISTMKGSVKMPVPSSFNDIIPSKAVRDHVGWVWYQTKFHVPASWRRDGRVFIRFGSVHYNAKVVSPLAMNS